MGEAGSGQPFDLDKFTRRRVPLAIGFDDKLVKVQFARAQQRWHGADSRARGLIDL